MKTIKAVRSRRTIWKQRCIRDPNQYKLNVSKGDNDKLLNLKNKSVKQVIKSKSEAGEGNKLISVKINDFPNKNIANQKTKPKNEIDEKSHQNNISNAKKGNKISSQIVFRRKFSKYKDVRQKIKPKFNSIYKSSGQFNDNSTNYNAYVNSNENKRNKSILKYALCKKNKEMKKKSSKLCRDLPGRGTYNHRYAYDTALKLHQKGVDVNVMYKVKSKTDSIYVINGEFVINKQSNIFGLKKKYRGKNHAKTKTNDQIGDNVENEKIAELNKIEEEEALWLKELAKTQEANKNRKKRLAMVASMLRAKSEEKKKQKLEDFARKQNLREIEKKLRAEKIKKILNAKTLKEELHRKSLVDNTKVQKEDKKTDKDKERSRLNIPPNILLNFKKNIEKYNNAKINNTCDKHEVITDRNNINDIKNWVLKNDCTTCVRSWLKIVACRIDSLDQRVDKSYKRKWMQMAIDEAIDIMAGDKQMSIEKNKKENEDVGHRKCMFNNNVQVSSSFVVKTKRTLQCHKHETATCSIRKSPKFSICHVGKGSSGIYKAIKTKEDSFRVINIVNRVDAFGLKRCQDYPN